MHSRIFILAKDKNTTIDDINLWWRSDPACIAPSVDYVVESDYFDSDIKWLENVYGIKVENEDGKYYLSVENLKTMEELIQAEARKRLERVKKLIKAAEESMEEVAFDWLFFNIAAQTWNNLGFFFFINNMLMKDVEFLQYIKRTDGCPLWIIGSYDYHF